MVNAFSQAHHGEYDALIEKSEELKKMANDKSKEDIALGVEEMKRKWNTCKDNLESREELLNKLGEDWNVS